MTRGSNGPSTRGTESKIVAGCISRTRSHMFAGTSMTVAPSRV